MPRLDDWNSYDQTLLGGWDSYDQNLGVQLAEPEPIMEDEWGDFDQAMGFTPEGMTPFVQHAASQKKSAESAKKFGKYYPEVLSLMKSRRDILQARDVSHIPREDRKLFKGIWADLTSRLDFSEKGLASKTFYGMGTATTRSAEAMESFGRDVVGVAFGIGNKAGREDHAFAKELNEIFRAREPMAGRNRVEQGFLDASRMVPDVGASLAAGVLGGGPPGFFAYWIARSYPDLKDEMVRDGIDPQIAHNIAMAASVPIAGIEMLQVKQYAPGATSAAKLAVKEAVIKRAKSFGKLLALEWSEELGQEIVQVGAKAAAHALDENAPGIDWKKQFDDSMETMLRVTFSLPFLVGPGQAVGAIQDIQAPELTRLAQTLTPEEADQAFKQPLEAPKTTPVPGIPPESVPETPVVFEEATEQQRLKERREQLPEMSDAELLEMQRVFPRNDPLLPDVESELRTRGLEVREPDRKQPQISETTETPSSESKGVGARIKSAFTRLAGKESAVPEPKEGRPDASILERPRSLILNPTVETFAEEHDFDPQELQANVGEVVAEKTAVWEEDQPLRDFLKRRPHLAKLARGEKDLAAYYGMDEILGDFVEHNPQIARDSQALWERLKEESVPKPKASDPEIIQEAADRLEADQISFEPSLLNEIGKSIPHVPQKEFFISDESMEQARQRIVEAAKGKLFANPLDPKLVKDLTVYGAGVFERGARKFADWSRQMLADAGERIRPYLRSIWKSIKPQRVQVIEREKKTGAVRKALGKPVPASVTTGLVKRAGRPGPAETVISDVRQLLKYALQHEARGAKKGYRAGQLALKATHEELLAFARNELPESEQRRVMPVIAKARTASEVRTAIAAVRKIAESFEKAAAVRELKDALRKSRKAKLRPEFKARVDDLLKEFSLSTPRGSTLRKMRSILDASEVDDIGEIPQKLVDYATRVLQRETQRPIRSLAPDEIRGVADAIRSVVHLNVTKNRLHFGRKIRDVDKAIEASVREVLEHGKKDFPASAAELHRDPSQNLLKRLATTAQFSHDTRTYLLTGADTVTREILFDNLKQGHRLATELQMAEQDAVRDGLREIGLTAKELDSWSVAIGRKPGAVRKGTAETQTVTLPTATNEAGQRVPELALTRAERVELLLHLNDPDTRAEILKDKSMGIVLERSKSTGAVKLRSGDVKAILDSASTQEKAVAALLGSRINGPLKDRLNEAWLEEFGIEIATREDYFPRRRANEYSGSEPNQAMQGWRKSQLESQGIFKDRTGGRSPILIGDAFATFFTHTNRVAAFVGKSRPVHDAKRLLESHEFQQTVRRKYKYGNEILSEIKKTVEHYEGLSAESGGVLSRFVRWFNRNAHKAALGLKPHIVLYQTVSLTTASTAIKEKYLAKSIVGSNEQTRKEIVEQSALLRSRIEGGGHQIVTPLGRGPATAAVGEFYGKPEGVIDRVAMKPISLADTQVMYRIWRAAKLEGQDKGLSGDALLEQTARRAEEIVDSTQPTWDPLTISSLAREARANPMAHLAVMFSSQRNKNFNMMVREIGDLQHSDKSPRALAKFAKNVGTVTLINSMLIYGIAKAYQGLLYGSDDEDDWIDHGSAIAEKVFGNWLIVGDGVSSAMNAARSGSEKKSSIFTRPRGTVLLSTADDGLKMIHEGSKAIAEAVQDERFKAGIKKGEKKAYYSAIESARRATRMLGMATGTPLQGIEMIVRPHLPASTTGELSDDALTSGIAVRTDVLARLQPNPSHVRVSEMRATGRTRAELLTEKKAAWEAEVDKALQWFRGQGTQPKEIRVAYRKSEQQRIRSLQTDFLQKRRTRSEANAHGKRLWDAYRDRLNRINAHLKKLGS